MGILSDAVMAIAVTNSFQAIEYRTFHMFCMQKGLKSPTRQQYDLAKAMSYDTENPPKRYCYKALCYSLSALIKIIERFKR